MNSFSPLFMVLTVCAIVASRSVNPNEAHKRVKRHDYFDESNGEHWKRDAQWTLKTKVERPFNTRTAKNIVLFLGDGMSVTTIAATRQYVAGHAGVSGEELKLSFEGFPHTGLAKTYCVDRQVADSACSATAYLCGAKANYGTIGLSGAARRGVCSTQENERNQLQSIAAWAQQAGKKTGVVTTTRVTHASPGGVYAHAAERGWESDTDVTLLHGGNCTDIATQLVRGSVGSKLNVIFGGGRRNLLPNTFKDSENRNGSRSDGVNLISEWMSSKRKDGRPAYVFNKKGLMDLKVTNYSHIMGLFDSDHMPYHLDADLDEDPTLEEMTIRAIENLSYHNPHGYFLFVEGGKIDMAHHETKARKALDETAEFSKAVEAAIRLVDLRNTLVVVTADHSHTMSYNGYNTRGSDVLGPSQNSAADGLPYMILSYANGPGYRGNDDSNQRHNVMIENINDVNYTFPALIPLNRETHGGEDVAVYANGPWSHLFSGNWEQTFLPHAMAYAACIGPGITACDY